MDSMDSKEYIWCTKLTTKSKSKTYEGQEDGALEQLVLKRACLGPEAKEKQRNIVEVTSFDHNQEKVQVSICSLQVGLKEDTSLSDITILPPAVFKLVQGEGPVHLVANHMLLEEGDDLSEDEVDSDDAFAQQTFRSSVKAKTAKQEVTNSGKKSFMDDEADDDDIMEDDDDDMDDDDDIDDDDDLDDDGISDEDLEEEIAPPSKKSKGNEENRAPKVAAQQKAGKKTPTTPKHVPTTPKRPLQQKQSKTPQSEQKKAQKTPSQLSAKKKGKKV